MIDRNDITALGRAWACWAACWAGICLLAATLWAAESSSRPAPPRPPGRLLGELLDQSVDSFDRFDKSISRLQPDDAAVAAEGIRKLSGRWVTLYTDLPAAKEIDDLPALFDAAVPQYCRYFGIDEASLGPWRATACVMKDRERFVRANLLPPEIPAFQFGYARNYDLWLDDQPSDYYRRHLLLHEGVHCFMNTQLGACGPPWFMEGTAELLATHHWDGRALSLGVVPRHKEDVPMWGRIKIIRDELAAKRGKRIDAVLDLRPTAYLENDAYAWSWALAVLLDHHPRYQARFRQMQKHVLDKQFNEKFRQAFADDWAELAEHWQLFVMTLEYGHDAARDSATFAAGKPPAPGATCEVAADRGWQSSGWAVEAGKSYTLRASGRYQVAAEPKPWPCEPGGVTIRYYQGRPLGMLLMGIRPDAPATGLSALLRPSLEVGLGCTFTAERSGTLYFKINELPSEWADNAGSLQVEIRPAGAPAP